MLSLKISLKKIYTLQGQQQPDMTTWFENFYRQDLKLEFWTDALRISVLCQPASRPDPSWSLFSFFLLFSISSLCYCLSAALPLSSLLSCNRKFSQLLAKVSLRFAGGSEDKLGWGWRLRSRGSWSGCSLMHLKGATHTANRRSRTWIRSSLELGLWSWQLRKNGRAATAAKSGWLIWSFPFMVSKCCL